MVRRIHIDFRKYPNTRHWQFAMDHLGEDEHGIWLWREPGWAARRGDEPPVTMEHLAVFLVTPGDWWSAIWNGGGSFAVYADINTPATWNGDRVTMIDLDLDVGRRGNGPVEIYDEDEFAEHQVTLGYPQELIDQALATTERTAAAMEAGAEPFGTTANMWLDRARSLNGNG